MAVDALIISYGELAVGGKVYRWGVRDQPTRHSVTGANVSDQVIAVEKSPAAAVLLWSALIDSPATFALLVLETDQAVMVEFVTDDGGEVGEEVFTVELNPGIPLILGDDASYADYTVNFASGTLDTIEAIRAKNLGATDAKVRRLLSD